MTEAPRYCNLKNDGLDLRDTSTMHAAQLRRRAAKMEESARRREKADCPDDPNKSQLNDPSLEQLRLASFRSRSRASAIGRGRVQAMVSAVAIGFLLLLVRTQKSRSLPEAYALCSAYGERNIWTASDGDSRYVIIVLAICLSVLKDTVVE
jgi:hypothetical protein